MKRRIRPEQIDDPDISVSKLEYLLRCVRLTNRRLGGTDSLLSSLAAWSPRWPKGREVTLLDIGTGSGDLPLAAARWARESGHSFRVVGIDANSRVLEVARRLCADEPGVELRHCDAMTLLDEATSPFAPGSFDYVHAGMFVHHLEDPMVPRMLLAMNRIARAGIVWNDLIRSRRGYAVAWLATIGLSIRHDCLASLHAGFREHEVLDLAQQAGLTYTTHRERYFCQRFTLAGERAEAWDRAQDARAIAGLAAIA